MDFWYITGICESVGSFTYSKVKNNISLYFAIKMSCLEKNLIEELYSYFKVGKIYTIKKSLYYRVSKLEDLGVIVSHFDAYPLKGEKHKRYNIWRRMYLIRSGLVSAKNKELNELRLELSALNPRKINK